LSEDERPEGVEQPEPQPESQPQPQVEPHDDAGLDLARSIARGLAGRTPSQQESLSRTRARMRPRRRVQETQSSGAHPDDRDPQTLDASMARFVGEQGWQTELRVQGVFARWSALVGADVAEHAHPESFNDGRLVVRTDSTAWATQITLLTGDLLRRLNEVLGDATVTVIDVAGPRAPSWKRGRLRVKGRGPRDTYG
jgi:predicted nucleic acid-binding Zn ribbon protein